jgi:hypothetical protein
MDSALNESLGLLEACWRRAQRTKLLDHLSPGQPAERTRAELAKIGLPSNVALETLYSWHDGCRWEPEVTLGDMYMFPLCAFPPLRKMIGTYQELKSSEFWEPRAFPIFEDGGGDYYTIDRLGEKVGRIRHVNNADPGPTRTEFRSLLDMVNTVIAAYDRGVFYLGTDGYLGEDFDGFLNLAAEMNPRVRWWHDAEFRDEL